MEQISFVKACQEFFTKPPFGKRIEISEFKDLTREDKVELREMLIAEGYDVAPLVTSI
jgi:hypothetical protein